MVAAVLIFLLFFLPWLWGEEIQRAETEEPDGGSTALPETEEVPATVYDSARTLRVKIGDTVQEMDLETYLRGVVRAEMPASFELEALKAQAIAARTYTYYKMENGPSANHPDADACDDITCCQAYKSEAGAAVDWGMSTAVYENKIRRAVAETDGEVVLYEGAPVLAVFHSSSAGATQNVEDVWQSSLPYLQSVDSPEGADAVPNYYSKVSFTLTDFKERFIAQYPTANLSGSPSNWFTNIQQTETGAVLSLEVGGVALRQPKGPQVGHNGGVYPQGVQVLQPGGQALHLLPSGHGVAGHMDPNPLPVGQRYRMGQSLPVKVAREGPHAIGVARQIDCVRAVGQGHPEPFHIPCRAEQLGLSHCWRTGPPWPGARHRYG